MEILNKGIQMVATKRLSYSTLIVALLSAFMWGNTATGGLL
jgi:hypothetical protein